jgi:hypothetical protein
MQNCEETPRMLLSLKSQFVAEIQDTAAADSEQ